jgi:hypothetical protein
VAATFRSTASAALWGRENAKDGYRVNLGCVEGLDPLALDVSLIDGKSVPLVQSSS